MEYLKEKLAQVHKKLDEVEAKKPARLEAETFKRLRSQIEEYQELITHPDQLEKSGKNSLIAIRNETDTLQYDLESLDQEPDSIETLNSKIDQLTTISRGVTDKQVEALTQEREGLQGEFADIGKEKEIEGIEYLTELKKELEKIKNDLSQGKLDIDQRQQLQRDLDAKLIQFGGLKLSEKIDLSLNTEKMTDAQRARRVITELKGETDIKKIKSILQNRLKPEQVDFVSDKKFENYKDLNGGKHNLKEYTKGGMVFYEHGDQWRIVINEDLLKNKNAGAELQKQITHELLHVEFENNPALKEYWVNQYTQNPKWNKIKKAFVDQSPNKRPPNFIGPARPEGYTPEEWPNEAVVSELYAMEAHDNKASEIGEVIAKAGVAGVTPKFLGYDEGSEQQTELKNTSEPDEEGGAEGGSETKGDYNEFAKEIEGIRKEIKDYKNSEYVGYLPGVGSILSAMNSFSDETEEMNERFKQSRSGFLATMIKERTERPKEDLEAIKEEIKRVSEVAGGGGNPIRDIWNRSTFLSLEDLFQVAVNMKEFISRRSKRRVADHSARIGMALFDKIPFLSDFATESSAQKEKAEADEVSEWEGRLSNKDVPTLYDMLNDISKNIDPNKDQFKAILRVLADKGALDWRTEPIWIILSKLQNVAKLSVNDPLIRNDFNLLRSRIKSAMGEIWDKDEFLNLENKNESGYKSRKDAHNAKIDKSSGNIGGQLESLYLKYINGRQGEVEPAEYEALIEYAIVNGRYNAEKSLFYLVAGMATGILSPDRGEALDNHSSVFPALDWISMSSNCKTTEQWRQLCEENFGNEFRKGSLDSENSTFINYYHTTVANSFGFQQRMTKAVSADKKWDPDWCRAIASAGNAHVMRIHMAGTSGRVQLTEKHAENTIAGMLQWFEENAKNPEGNWKDNFIERMSALAMSEAIYAGVAYSSDKNFFRIKSIFSNVPLEAGSTNHPGETAGTMRNKMLDYAGQFSEGYTEFLALITDSNREEEDLLEGIKAFLSRYSSLNSIVSGANKLDVIFNSLDTIIKAILSEIPEEVFMTRTKQLLTSLQ
ncbi:hypothetical protein KAR91_54305 [Candidatus Pacearchaeota archaeon]|nr:hypothetical protein [Candidatus Pacearchaeota archaeon]